MKKEEGKKERRKEGRRKEGKKEEGRRKKEEGRRKKEETNTIPTGECQKEGGSRVQVYLGIIGINYTRYGGVPSTGVL
jgi:hypothetical protein